MGVCSPVSKPPPSSSKAAFQLMEEKSTVIITATRIAVPEAPRIFQVKTAFTGGRVFSDRSHLLDRPMNTRNIDKDISET